MTEQQLFAVTVYYGVAGISTTLFFKTLASAKDAVRGLDAENNPLISEVHDDFGNTLFITCDIFGAFITDVQRTTDARIAGSIIEAKAQQRAQTLAQAQPSIIPGMAAGRRM